MDLRHFSLSEGFFEYSEPLAARARKSALQNLCRKICIVPGALFYKLYRTATSSVGFVFSCLFLILTLFASQNARDFFIRKVESLAKEAADWILWPIAVSFCLLRLTLAVLFKV